MTGVTCIQSQIESGKAAAAELLPFESPAIEWPPAGGYLDAS
jgi:hypothetical protein